MDQPDKTYDVQVNGFSIQLSDQDLQAADLVPTGPGTYHLLVQHRSNHVRILHTDLQAQRVSLEMNGTVYEVSIRDPLLRMLEQMGFNAGAARQVKEIRAPMPGLVLDILVVAGQELGDGEKILILEAMKMENSLMIHHAARIREVHVEKGQAVEKNQVLVTLE